MSQAPLPRACGLCTYFQASAKLCRRHAPQSSREAFELAYWPQVASSDRCGVGAEYADGAPMPVRCGVCIHWHQPEGQPPKPPYGKGRPAEWWASVGYCTRFAPSPTAEVPRSKTYWKITHSTDGCGDGEEPGG
jgi:hypothetical protein